jgi:hypothetical protein
VGISASSRDSPDDPQTRVKNSHFLDFVEAVRTSGTLDVRFAIRSSARAAEWLRCEADP